MFVGMVTRIFSRMAPCAYGSIPRKVDWSALGACGLGELSPGAHDSAIVQWIRSGHEVHEHQRLDVVRLPLITHVTLAYVSLTDLAGLSLHAREFGPHQASRHA